MPNFSPTKLTAFAWIGICLALDGQASVQKQALYRRGGIPTEPMNNSNNSSTTPGPHASTANRSAPNITSVQPAANWTAAARVPPNNKLEDCGAYPLDPSTWLRFGWDDYLRTYPNGANLTTEAYAASKGAVNFKCGVGENCNVGQLCSPVKAPDWYILYAAQNLNVYLNTLHQVTGEAISLTQSTMASVWNDLFPAIIDHKDLETVFILSVIAASIQAVGVLYLLFIPNPALLFITVPFAIMSVVNMEFTAIMCNSLLPIILGQAALSSHDMSGPVQSEEFTSWSRFNYRLSQWQEETQNLIMRTTHQVFNSGLNSDAPYSLSHVLTNGTFISPLERKNSFEIQADVKNITQSLAISGLLRSMNAFVTISNDPHPSKKWQSKDRLSFLSPNGTLMNIIRVVPGNTKAINDFKNGHVLHEKYGVSTEDIATISFECQQQFGIQKKNITTAEDLNHRNPFLTNDIKACSFDLPVCDLRLPELQHERHKNKRVAKICRDIVGLPI